MSDHKELQALVEFNGSRGVLSVYLDTDLSMQSKEAVKLMFRELVKDLDPAASEDVGALQRFLDFEYAWQSRGLAVFASGDELWRVLPLPIAVTSQAWYTSRPYLPLLTDITDRFGEYSIALIDKESVRLFSVAWGKIQSETESYGEELKRHRQEGWYAAGYQRHEDNLALHNLKQAIDVVQDYCQRTDCKRLMLGGSADVLAQFKDLAPKLLLNRVIGEFTIHMTASPVEILHRSLDIAYQTDLEEEKRIVTEAITAAAKGGAGVTGASDTLYSLHQGRVRVLLAEESFHTPGYICSHCGYLSADAHAECPICKSVEIDETPDVVNIAIYKAIETGAKVNIVRDNAMLQEAGGIAAVLRY
jgi:peptide chain release factor subunit 1